MLTSRDKEKKRKEEKSKAEKRKAAYTPGTASRFAHPIENRCDTFKQVLSWEASAEGEETPKVRAPAVRHFAPDGAVSIGSEYDIFKQALPRKFPHWAGLSNARKPAERARLAAFPRPLRGGFC